MYLQNRALRCRWKFQWHLQSLHHLLCKAPDGRIALVHNPSTPRRSRLELWLGDGINWSKKLLIAADNKRNLNYPDGYFDCDGNLKLIWEDARSVFGTVIANKFFK